jgi:hypothetical protein
MGIEGVELSKTDKRQKSYIQITALDTDELFHAYFFYVST